MRRGVRIAAPILLLLVASLPGVAHAQATPKAGPVFESGMAQAVPAFSDPDQWIREELWVETEFDSDGDGRRDRMHVSVARQRQTETEGLKVPVIYGSSPYYAGTAGGDDFFWDVHQEPGTPPPPRAPAPAPRLRLRPFISDAFVDTWLPRGFAVVHSSSPGTGLSEGCPTVGGINESLAPKAVVDWINGRANGYRTADGDERVRATWATGKVGMTGTSYNGTLPLAAATTGVEGLEAVIPDAPNTSYWHYYRANGLVRNPGGYPGEDVDVLYDFIHSREARREWCDVNVRDGEMAAGQDRTTGDYNDFWAGRDYTNAVDGIRAAVFLSHGLGDWNVMPDHSIRIYRALRERDRTVRMYLHQGRHGGPPPDEMMNRWFTHYLYGVDNGVEAEPRVWIVREDADRDAPTPYADFPNPLSTPVTLYPEGDGHGTGSLVTEREYWSGTGTVVDNVSFGAQTLATAEWTEHRLLFAGPVLTDSLHLSGTVRVTIRAAADRPAVNLSVYLVALPWTETRTWRGETIRQGGLVTRGWADLQNHASLTESGPLVPGEFYSMTFDLEPDDQVIPSGERLGLVIFSSDRDFTLWPRPGAELTVDLDQTSLEIPVVGGPEAWAHATGGK